MVRQPIARKPIGPKTHWSEDPLARKSVIGPKTICPKKYHIGLKTHWSESVIGPKIAGPKGRVFI